MPSVQIFLSTVSKEFRSYRDALRHDLDRPNVTIKVQEDFIATGTETLDKLDEYIRHCDAVLHLVGDMTGALAEGPSVAAIRLRYPDLADRLPVLGAFLPADAPALSYTQWEAWLALYHGKTLVIAVPHAKAPRDEQYRLIDDQRAAQQAHLARLQQIERYPEIQFTSADRLAVDMLRSKLQDIVSRAGGVTKPINLPYRSLGDQFQSRNTLLVELTTPFDLAPTDPAGVVALVVTGMSGVGKTRLALEYAWNRAEQYNALLFVRADSPQALRSGLAGLCRQAVLDLAEKVDADESKQFDAAVRWLRLHPGWLLILDNLDSDDDVAAVEQLLPQLSGGHVLLTSQLAHWNSGFTQVVLDVLSTDAATELLLARTASKRRPATDDRALARSLAETLGRLPLALEQAAAYIATRRLTFASYLADWQAQRADVLAWFDPRLMTCDSNVAMAIQTSSAHLGAGAARLLQRLAWFDTTSIPESLLDVPVPDSAAGDFDAYDALAELESQSLVGRAIDTPTFSVHRLVQQITRRGLPKDEAHAVLAEAMRWIAAAFTGNAEDVRTWPLLDPLRPHAQAVAAFADAAGIADPTARLMNQSGVLLSAKARYGEARALIERALEIRERALGPNHPDVAESLQALALIDTRASAHAKAEALCQRALAIREKALGPWHPDVAKSLAGLAAVYWNQGDYSTGEPLHRRALAIREKALGPDHPDVAESLESLGALYNMQEKFTKAEPFHTRALAIQERALGPDHPELAVTLNNIAYLYCVGEDDYAKAKPLFERALAIKEKALGPEHPDVAFGLDQVAAVHKELGAQAVALQLHERALAIREKTLGPEHPEVADSLDTLSTFHADQGDGAKALPLAERSLAIREKVLGSDSAEVADSLVRLAKAREALGTPAQAEPLLLRALAIHEKLGGPEFPRLWMALADLATHYLEQGAKAKAKPLLKRADAIEARAKK